MEKTSKLIDKRKNWEARVEMAVFEISKDELGTYDKLVYAILCGHANRAGNAWPRVSLLAAEASCSERQVQRALSNLEARGLLVRIPQITDIDGQIANIYEIYGVDAYTPGDCQSPGGTTDSRGAGDQQSGPIDELEQPQDSTAPNTPPTPQTGDGKGDPSKMPEGAEQEPKTPAAREKALHGAIVEAYNAVLPELPKCKSLGKSVAESLRARIRDDPERETLAWWRQYFESVRTYPTLMGRTINWRASLQWLIGVKNMDKVLNGFYPTDEPGGPNGGRTRAGEDRQRNYTNGGGEIDVLALMRDTRR